MAKGNCSHFTHMNSELMQKTITLKKQLDDYREEYRNWIKTSGGGKKFGKIHRLKIEYI